MFLLDFLWRTPFEILGRGDGEMPCFSMKILNKKKRVGGRGGWWWGGGVGDGQARNRGTSINK